MTTEQLGNIKALLELADVVEKAQTLKLITPEERQAAYEKITPEIKTAFITILP